MNTIDWASIHQELKRAEAELHLTVSREAEHWPDLLHQRARQLRNRSEGQTIEGAAHLHCRLGQETVLLPIEILSGVDRFADCAPLPLAPAALIGICPHRGQMVSVLDLALLLDLPASPQADEQGYVLYVHTRPVLGLRVDAIGELRLVSAAELAQSLPGKSPLLSGLLGSGELLLSLEQLCQHPLLANVVPEPQA